MRGAVFQKSSINIQVWFPKVDDDAVDNFCLQKFEDIVLLEVFKSCETKDVFLKHHHSNLGRVVRIL